MLTGECVQILKEDGTANSARLTLGKTQLLELYRVMVTTRAFDDRNMKLQRQGRIGFYVPSFGQEAASIGAAAALEAADWIFPSYRSPGIPILRGVPLVKMLNNNYGNAGDTAKGRQMPVHYSFKEANFVSISSPIGTQIVQAAGAAYAAKIRGDGRVVMTLFGDGATSSNDFHTGLNFAGVWKAPCIFFCENNQYTISLNYCGQTGSATIAEKAVAYGMPGIRVDGNDVLAVYEETTKAVERARRGEGPTLIEALTFRIGPHSSSDDPTRYRPTAETEEWRRRDPIQRFKTFLMSEGILSEALDADIQAVARDDIDAAVKEAEAIAQPIVSTLFEDVYANVPASLLEQKTAHLIAEGEHGGAADPNAAFPL
jgi:pyruvate dehydrogenase E1 component alpha subunit